ncbi:MAG: 2'-deoxycytidine 5'-triphosphate deaminase, partial [Rhodobacteraceae bacterium]|nr:2'-deoxycytidine 5'-triphosphate deaminase [Paracoccaceae bacterium]
TRLITDHCTEFDRIKGGYSGPLYAEVCPKSFSVLVQEGISLNQIRFNLGKTQLSQSDFQFLQSHNNYNSATTDFNKGLLFSVDLELEGDIVGFRAKAHTGIVDLRKTNYHDHKQFWDPVYAENSELILDPSSFYILTSREEVVIPPGFAAEMEPYLPMVGEFRVHYAGFFDPGFGHGGSHGKGSRGVLEVRCHEVPFLLVHGQNVGRLMFEKMLEPPQTPYGLKSHSNYQGQKLKLSKHFKT